MMNEMNTLDVNNENEHSKESESTYIPAGFWMRFWAYMVDLLIVSSISGIVLSPLYTTTNINEASIWIYSISGIIGAIISFGYFTILTKVYQQTIGKRIFGIIVYSEIEQDLLWRDVIMREVIGRYIHQSLIITNLLYLVIPFQERKKGIHDMIADTFVVLEPRKGFTKK
ncbi:RDD family protein [Evansella sp. AB-rgal1]|uniref:RDD family protein n=1 Tax=Evansella sp. AB-rgal1 TaxID=3242696 RepID=UPI00359F1101